MGKHTDDNNDDDDLVLDDDIDNASDFQSSYDSDLKPNRTSQKQLAPILSIPIPERRKTKS